MVALPASEIPGPKVNSCMDEMWHNHDIVPIGAIARAVDGCFPLAE